MTTNDRCGRGGEGGDVHRPYTFGKYCIHTWCAICAIWPGKGLYNRTFPPKENSGVEGKGVEVHTAN